MSKPPVVTVTNSTPTAATKPILRVLHAAAEFQGIAKTGGLADMVAALSSAQLSQNIDVRICVPAYTGSRQRLIEPRAIATLHVHDHTVHVIEGRLNTNGPLLWLIDCIALFGRGDNPYRDNRGAEFDDNALRFGVFSAAVARLATGAADWIPDIVHLHDWHCGLAAAWLSSVTNRPRIIFTIHNLAHQGLFDRAAFDALALPAHWWQIDGVEFYQQLSFMKAGLQFCDAITTVSPTYAQEIQTPDYGCKLDGLLRARSAILHGIVNGIDDQQWNPATDTLIAAPYHRETVTAGKQLNKRALQRQLGLPELSLPLVIFIGRLADQKGADLILAAQDAIGKMALQFVLLGSGDHTQEQACLDWAKAAPDQVKVLLQVDEALAHQLTAAADLQIMPSRFEPCGLNQMYAQRYGTLPIVRRTGGLADTVVDATALAVANHSATGVVFDHADIGGILYGLQRGLELVNDQRQFDAMRQTAMSRNFSWENSAREYLNVYRATLPFTTTSATIATTTTTATTSTNTITTTAQKPQK